MSSNNYRCLHWTEVQGTWVQKPSLDKYRLHSIQESLSSITSRISQHWPRVLKCHNFYCLLCSTFACLQVFCFSLSLCVAIWNLCWCLPWVSSMNVLLQCVSGVFPEPHYPHMVMCVVSVNKRMLNHCACRCSARLPRPSDAQECSVL